MQYARVRARACQIASNDEIYSMCMYVRISLSPVLFATRSSCASLLLFFCFCSFFFVFLTRIQERDMNCFAKYFAFDKSVCRCCRQSVQCFLCMLCTMLSECPICLTVFRKKRTFLCLSARCVLIFSLQTNYFNRDCFLSCLFRLPLTLRPECMCAQCTTCTRCYSYDVGRFFILGCSSFFRQQLLL